MPESLLKRLEQDAIWFLVAHDLRVAFDERCKAVPRVRGLRDLMQQAVDGKVRFTWEAKP